MAQPVWVTPPGTLGTIPEGVFYSIPLVATADGSVFYKVIAGSLPPGVQINETGVLAGNPLATSTVQGVPVDVVGDTTSQFVVRAYTQRVVNGVTVIDKLADRTFSLTIAGISTVTWTTPSGNIGTYFDGVQVFDLVVNYTDPDIYANNIVTVIAGALPPGLTVSTAGVISGYIIPDLTTRITERTYSFTLKVSNGVSSDTRTFSILVYARVTMTADNTQITADNTFITADVSPLQPPVIFTPAGSIGSTRSDNFYAFEFDGFDPNGNAIEYVATTALPPGLTLDPISGWMYGYIPFEGILSNEYNFSIFVREINNPDLISGTYDYSLTINGPVNSDIVWVTPTDEVERARVPSSLGFIDNGATSTFYVEAVNVSGIALQYQLLSGSDSRLPQGLQLSTSGHIEGRVSFNTFCLDGGTTTFDVNLNTVDQPTTFDLVAIFTVNAFSVNGLVNVNKTFSITVVRRYQEPYDNLYIQAMPPQDDRDLLASLLQNPTIFPPSLIYRADDPNFGVARNVVYNHAYGLTAATYDDYVASLNLNHYWKNLVLGEIKTAQALDDEGNVIYEVVYSEVIDNLVNNDDVSVDKQVVLAFPINADTFDQIDSVYPNSLQNMRDQVIDVVGQISNVLPRWMLSRQANGRVLGFTPAWVIAYTNPGQSGQIAYNIQTQFGTQLNLVDFKADRYELDNFLTKNWNREDQHWGYVEDSLTPYPPSLTTFDFVGLPPFQAFRTTLVGAGTSAVNQTYAQIGPYKYAGTTNSEWIMTSINFGNTWNIEHSSSSTIYYTSSDLISWSAVNGATPAPTASFYRVGDVVIYQTVETTEPGPTVYKDGAYRVTKLYKCIQNTIPGILPTNTNYWSTDGTNLASWINNYLELTTWEDEFNTLANWTYATPPGTTFDGGSMQFAAPVDMYSNNNTTEYDKYLLFPKINILQ
jgi:hypothetical protein